MKNVEIVQARKYILRDPAKFSVVIDPLMIYGFVFKKLMSMGIPNIIIRLLINIYLEQTANVRWKNENSI